MLWDRYTYTFKHAQRQVRLTCGLLSFREEHDPAETGRDGMGGIGGGESCESKSKEQLVWTADLGGEEKLRDSQRT